MKTHWPIAVCLLVTITGVPVAAEKPLGLGSRLELFVDDYLIDKTSGDVEQVLQKPKPQEVVLVTDVDGKPLPGFSAEQCQPLVGDEIDAVVRWSEKENLSKLAGTPVRLQFEMQDADLYSLQFRK